MLGVVGESGSGKTVSLLAVMGLITDPNAMIEGSIKYRGRELIGLPSREMRKLRGKEIAMIFQDPMTALTPVYTVGWQIAEQILAHEKVSKAAAWQRADRSARGSEHSQSAGRRSALSAPTLRRHAPTSRHRHGACPAIPHSWWPTSRPRLSTLRCRHKSSSSFASSRRTMAAPLSSSRMTWGSWPRSPTASWSCMRDAWWSAADKRDLFLEPRHPYTKALLDSIPPLSGEKPYRLRAIPGMPPNLLNRPAGCAFAPRCIQRFDRCGTEPALIGEAHAAACFRVNS